MYQKHEFSKETDTQKVSVTEEQVFLSEAFVSAHALPCSAFKGFPAHPNMNLTAEFSSWRSAFRNTNCLHVSSRDIIVMLQEISSEEHRVILYHKLR